MFIQNAVFPFGGADSLSISSPTTADLTTFSTAIFLSGFRIQGILANGGVPSITLASNTYTISVINRRSNGIASTSYTILFYSNGLLESNNRFKVTDQNFMNIVS